MKNEVIKQIEKILERTIEQQYEKIKELEAQHQAKDFNSSKYGSFYVFNPLHGQPRKIYSNYWEAFCDASPKDMPSMYLQRG